jgi:putative membrane protein
MKMSEPKRLHPVASIVTTGKRIRNLILPMIVLNISGGRDSKTSLLLSLILSLIAVLITLITGIMSWLRYTYRFEDDELRIEYGVFLRKKRYIPFERIQSINITEGLLQRLFGLAKVEIETAGRGDEAEAVLSAIPKGEAAQIQAYVNAAKKDALKTTAEIKPMFKLSTQKLLLLSLTSGGMGVVISAVLAIFSQLDDLIPYKNVFGGVETWAVHNIILITFIVFLGFVLLWIISFMITMLKYAGFTFVQTETDFVISQGLLEKKQMTIPLNRIQAVRIRENLIRQMLGLGTVYLESAGGSSANIEGANVMLLPIVKVKDIPAIIGPYLPEYEMTEVFKPLPRRAMWRYIFRSWYMVIPIVLLSLIFLKIWGLLSLVLLVLATIRAFLNYKSAGWGVSRDQLSLKFRSFKRTTIYMKKNKIQSLEASVSYFQRRQGLGTLEAFVKSGAVNTGGRVSDLDQADLISIYRWYSREQEAGSRPE